MALKDVTLGLGGNGLTVEGNNVTLENITTGAPSVSVSFSSDAVRNVYELASRFMAGDASVFDEYWTKMQELEEDEKSEVMSALSSASPATGYPITIKGSGTTLRNSTFNMGNNYAVTLNDSAKSASTVLTVEGCTFERDALGTGLKVETSNFYGTMNMSSCTFKVKGNSMAIGSSSGTPHGTYNISNCTFDSTGTSVSQVSAVNFTDTTFTNTWDSSTMRFKLSVKATFTNCAFNSKAAFSAALTTTASSVNFVNCTYNGTPITAENVGELLTFTYNESNGANPLTVKVGGETVEVESVAYHSVT